jgi:hypothetical protein
LKELELTSFLIYSELPVFEELINKELTDENNINRRGHTSIVSLSIGFGSQFPA